MAAMRRYLSIDTEATGLEENCYLIQFAVVPVDIENRKVLTELGKEVLIKCPSFEELKPNLNPWVLEHNENLIKKAHAQGLDQEGFKEWLANYMESDALKEFFPERPPLLGKSLSALDIPLLTRYLSKKFMEAYFHHHTLDVTCVARYLVDMGKLPEGCESTSKLIRHLGVKPDASHTALADALDMATIYLKLLNDFDKLHV